MKIKRFVIAVALGLLTLVTAIISVLSSSSYVYARRWMAIQSEYGWHQVFPGQFPSARLGHGMTYDIDRDVTVLFGGDNTGSARTNETWEYDGNSWHLLAPTQSPPGRTNVSHALVYDIWRDRVVLFGGLGYGGYLNDIWEFNGSTWAQKVVIGSIPPIRDIHAMIYDPVRKVVVLFGGHIPGTYYGDTWEYDGNSWQQIIPSQSPPARGGHVMVYDGRRGTVVLFGGVGVEGIYLNDTWEYDGATWRQVFTPQSPPARHDSGAVYDANRGRMVLFGGESAETVLNDVWEYDGTTWQEITSPQSPAGRSAPGMAYDL